ncbi:conserved hypothetical protein [Haloferula helveola]|uniref:DUF4259 domain-containing protein n=1 Tax=Haloferula helveola TaxID=490095 RepID=A0ABN6H962_9BACT|nr:conserved hypothetical protein [Haloferula helveola]
MGSWDTTSFGNDAACDWLAELLDSGSMAMIDDALDSVLSSGDEPIESPAGEEAVAACEVLAWIQGRPGPSSDETEGLEDWVDEQEPDEDDGRLRRARRAIDRIFNHPCELREAWEESADFDEWRKSLTDLKGRLADS